MYKEAGTKPNFSDIARRYGKDQHTVATYWSSDGCRPHGGRADRRSAFEAHRDEIEQKATLPGMTKRGVYEYLLHRHADEALPKYGAFTRFMRTQGIGLSIAGGPEPHPRFETAPGPQPRFDWKGSVRVADRAGEVHEFNVFAATLSWSRRHVFIYSRTKGADDLVRCMCPTVARLGGVAAEWPADNMGALAGVRGGGRRRIRRVFDFARDAWFEIRLCKARSPETKGKVESSNRFLSRLMAYQGDFDGEDDLVEIIARIEERSNAEVNETTGMPPAVLFMDEKEALRPVGNMGALERAMCPPLPFLTRHVLASG